MEIVGNVLYSVLDMFVEKDWQKMVLLMESKEEDSKNMYCYISNEQYGNVKLAIAI